MRLSNFLCRDAIIANMNATGKDEAFTTRLMQAKDTAEIAAFLSAA
jgi:hypothetical protein